MPIVLRLVLAIVALVPTTALAHPHVFVTAKAEMVFDGAGMVTGVRNIWQFDKDFSALAVEGLDLDNDGILTPDELVPLAEINMTSLALYSFFTSVTIEVPNPSPDARTAFQAFFMDRAASRTTRAIELSSPTNYWLDIYDSQLTLFFTLPLSEPLRLGPAETLTMAVLDPEYIVAFDFVAEMPFVLIDAASDCSASHRLPGELSPQTAAVLGTIAMDQAIPPELLALTAELAHRFTVDCR